MNINIANVVVFGPSPHNTRDSDQIFENTRDCYGSLPFDSIMAWVGDVQDAVSLPSLVITPPLPPCYPDHYFSQKNKFFEIYCPIPRSTFTNILGQLDSPAIRDAQDPIKLLKTLPHHENLPLASISSHILDR